MMERIPIGLWKVAPEWIPKILSGEVIVDSYGAIKATTLGRSLGLDSGILDRAEIAEKVLKDLSNMTNLSLGLGMVNLAISAGMFMYLNNKINKLGERVRFIENRIKNIESEINSIKDEIFDMKLRDELVHATSSLKLQKKDEFESYLRRCVNNISGLASDTKIKSWLNDKKIKEVVSILSSVITFIMIIDNKEERKFCEEKMQIVMDTFKQALTIKRSFTNPDRYVNEKIAVKKEFDTLYTFFGNMPKFIIPNQDLNQDEDTDEEKKEDAVYFELNNEFYKMQYAN